jgi:hypothetical protein
MISLQSARDTTDITRNSNGETSPHAQTYKNFNNLIADFDYWTW